MFPSPRTDVEQIHYFAALFTVHFACLCLLTVKFNSYVDELIQELERERCAKIEAERKLKGIKLCYLHC